MKRDPRPLFISTMKNEGPYILEWLAYHRVIGFSDFLIYTNDCSDGTTDILDRLTALGLVQHEENVVLKRGPHKSALKYAKAHPMVENAEWIYVADIDEYLNIHLGDGTVQDLIRANPTADAIPVTWRLFSHNDHVELESPLLLDDFVDAERGLENGGQKKRFVKTLFRNDERIERFGLHVPIVEDCEAEDFVWIAPDGRVLGDGDDKSRPETEFGYSAAQVNHYAVRSLDGYLVKKDRGRANHYRQTLGSDYWRRMCRGGEEDRTIQRHLPAVGAEMDRLLQDETLATLHGASFEWHKAKAAELRAVPDFENLRSELLSLSAARDHERRADVAQHAAAGKESLATLLDLVERAQGTTRESEHLELTGREPKALIASLRQASRDIVPIEANLAATRLIDELESIFDLQARQAREESLSAN